MPKFNTITLIHNQEKNLNRILKSYKEQSLQPDEYVFVLDRCIDSSESIILEFAKNNTSIIVKNEIGQGFMAGYCRDIGLSAIINPENVLFLDGDCVLNSNKLFENFQRELCSNDNTIVLGSRKFENKTGSGIESIDRRLTFPWISNKIFIEGINNIVSDLYIARWNSLLISCCFGMSRCAINLVKKINNQQYGEYRIFPSVFDGNWGGEDIYLGWIVMLFNIKTIAIDPKIHVLHIWHENNYTSKYETVLQLACEKLIEYSENIGAPGIMNLLIDLEELTYNSIISNINEKGLVLPSP